MLFFDKQTLFSPEKTIFPQSCPHLIHFCSLKIFFHNPVGLFVISGQKCLLSRKVLNSLVGVFILFPESVLTRTVQVCRVVGVLYIHVLGVAVG